MNEAELIRSLEERVRQLEGLAAMLAPRESLQTIPSLQICAFTLGEELAAGSSADAWLIDYDKEDASNASLFRWLKTDEKITVHDPLETFSKPAWTRGYAFKGLSWDRWNVLQMACDRNDDDAHAAGVI